MLIWCPFGMFQFNHTLANLIINNLMAFIAAFLASESFYLKLTSIMKMYWIRCFFFATLRKYFAFFAKISVFLLNYCADFQKRNTYEKTCCSPLLAYFASLFSLPYDLRLSNISVEEFWRFYFDICFLFSNIKCTNL